MVKNHLHSHLNIGEGQVVHVTLRGHAANVFLVDDAAYAHYRQGAGFEHRSGGFYERSPAVLRPPAPGAWHLIIDLGGAEGEVSASVSVRPG